MRTGSTRQRGSGRTESGFTYIGLLIGIAILGLVLATTSEIWAAVVRHQKLEQLDWAGHQYAQAIGRYYYANVGSVRMYPHSFDELLIDHRYLAIKRHMRELYVNPFTNKTDWVVIPAPDGGIRGVQITVDLPTGSTKRVFVFVPSP